MTSETGEDGLTCIKLTTAGPTYQGCQVERVLTVSDDGVQITGKDEGVTCSSGDITCVSTRMLQLVEMVAGDTVPVPSGEEAMNFDLLVVGQGAVVYKFQDSSGAGSVATSGPGYALVYTPGWIYTIDWKLWVLKPDGTTQICTLNGHNRSC